MDRDRQALAVRLEAEPVEGDVRPWEANRPGENLEAMAARIDPSPPLGAVMLWWIPLGAGAHVVRVSGKVFEAVSALAQRRRPCDLYHSALEVTAPEGRFVIEVTPVTDRHGERRGVVAEGAVGTKWVGRSRLFRYEIRRWREGVIADADAASSGPLIVCEDPVRARRILDLVPLVPAPVWGRDELETGEMWNSNSVSSWLLAQAGVDTAQIQLPRGGRAPGWDAGLVVAARDVPSLSVTGGRQLSTFDPGER